MKEKLLYLCCRVISVFNLVSLILTLLFAIPALGSVRNGKIAFTSDRDGNREIYIMSADGTNQVRLTNSPLIDDAPVWSPDGRRIAYIVEKVGDEFDEFSIFTMNADGSNQVEITDGDNVEAGNRYTLGAASWRYRFESRELDVNGALADLELVGRE